MYSRLQLVRKYIRYYLTASNGKGHGIHSPFVYDFIRNVLNDDRVYDAYVPIGTLRAGLLKDKTLLEVEDMGAGSAVGGGRQRSVGDIARNAAKPEKLGRLLYRIARYYKCTAVVELGTSLGLSTAYLAFGASGCKLQATSNELQAASEEKNVDKRPWVWTIEGAGAVAAVAAKNFHELGLENITLIVGNFDEKLGGVLKQADNIDLAFVDGNHRLEPTLRYFHLLMSRCAPSSILIFDDIHWSAEMEEAWARIQDDPRVYMTIDLFFIGLVVLRNEFKVKQHFVIRV
ncbi:class I SAM-dependent methyltransferase [Flavitalea sp. BT771]|uniref:O-methyltransferase n=1 Tax=Flavitalea sp. BT771 TaxID=3063329 RepID=UPI0026E2BDFD|nr:class I SAM-dependent methyltransferase [Flavitalea sp. BT771]MDO6429843.1 class I SAM-dependent methyltransferase [Flavitalea sp. BT771]MDV6218029.1 class I SAM-dependent methyltransferase [Flavitalea sp. BT771]